jgi:ATP-dependent helicase/nuclease subunit A
MAIGGAETAGWEVARDRESWLLHLEAIRMLYVATTRAESRLVVSLARTARSRDLPDDRRRWTRAELLVAAAEGAGHIMWSREPGHVAPLPARRVTVEPPMPWEEYVLLRERALASAGVREADSATDIAHGVAPAPEGVEIPAGLLKEPRDLELPAWMKGRYGAAVGRAVHATLQTVDLVTGEGIDGVAEVQALAESVSDRLDSVRALARAGWSSATVRAAAEREHHKEIYVGAVLGGQLVEGYIDLLYRDDDGSLVVVDYKTDADPAPETVQAYRAQLAVYARALAEATGEQVSRGVLVFCREDGAVEREVGMGGRLTRPPITPPGGASGTGRGRTAPAARRTP